MTSTLKNSLVLALGGMILASPALANRHANAIADFKTERGNGLAKLSSTNASHWSAGLVIDPAKGPNGPLNGPQFKALREAHQRMSDSYWRYKSRLELRQPPEATMSLEQWWATLTSQDKSTLSQYGITAYNAGNSTIAPYFTKDTSTGAPKQIHVVDQDFFNSKTLQSWKNKTVTRYRTEYYSYPVYVASGCYCPPRLAYYATGSYQVAYTETTQVPASYQVAVESVTPHKMPQDVERTIQVPQNYTTYEPVYVASGCYCPPRLAYYQSVTRTRYVDQSITETVLKDQVTMRDDNGRIHIFAPNGASPDGNNNITFSTDADGNIIYGDGATAAENHSPDGFNLVANPGLPRPQ